MFVAVGAIEFQRETMIGEKAPDGGDGMNIFPRQRFRSLAESKRPNTTTPY